MIALAYPRQCSRMHHVRRDVHSLRAHIDDLLHKHSKSSLKSKIVHNSQRLEHLAEETLKDTQAYLQSHSRRALKLSRKRISRRPLASIAGAFVVGAALSTLIWRH